MRAAGVFLSLMRSSRSLISAIVWLAFVSLSQSQTIYVDDDTPYGTGDGSEANPFTTITEAISASIVGQTRTILVAAGTYADHEVDPIRIPAGVALIGVGMDSTFLHASVQFSDADSAYFCNVRITDISLQDFSCDCRGAKQHHEPDPVQIERCRMNHLALHDEVGQFYLINDNIIGGSLILSDAGDSAFVMINGNVFEGGDTNYSILVEENNAIAIAIQNNEIRQRDVVLTDPGEYLDFSSNEVQNGRIILHKRNNAFRDTTLTNIRDNMVTFDGTQVPPNDPYGRGNTAIHSEGQMVLISSNAVTCLNGMNGVESMDSIAWIMDNLITVDSLGFGLRLGCIYGEITGNEIVGGRYGIFGITDSSTISYNIVHYADTGIIASGFGTYTNNRVDSCWSDGLIIDGARGPFSGNEIRHNGGAGVRIVRAKWGSGADDVVDLGGGPDSCVGGNVFQWNAHYNLVVETPGTEAAIIHARYNRWNSEDEDSIRANEIYDGADDPSLSSVDFSSFVTDVHSIEHDLPRQYRLEQNYPNPFNPTTDIRYQIADGGWVTLKVYDVLGIEIETLVDEVKQPGEYSVRWDASAVSSGVYFYQLTAINPSSSPRQVFIQTKKMLVIK